MKSRFLFFIGLLSITGCASLHSKIYKEVHEGDPQDHVEEVLGEPDNFQTASADPSVKLWIYKKKADICTVALKEQKVVATGCEEDPDYVSPGRRIARAIGGSLQGAAQGIQSYQPTQQQNPSVSCTTQQIGNTGYTNCY
jgi:hypothetical protein